MRPLALDRMLVIALGALLVTVPASRAADLESGTGTPLRLPPAILRRPPYTMTFSSLVTADVYEAEFSSAFIGRGTSEGDEARADNDPARDH